MLADLIIGRAMVAPHGIDVHRHATFSCSMARLIRKVLNFGA
ncbi:hypothetical protein GGD81_000128 [Rhodobium orientis]|nr:hypothetical protein [Rhodobium orientis]